MAVNAKKIYLIGIKGVGMTMLAQFLAEQGHQVSGSDIADSFLTDKVLKDSRIRVFSPFSSSNIPTDADLVIYSSAYNETGNIELFELRNNPSFRQTRVLSYAAALGEIFNGYFGIAVCGSHGKTTTSAWLGYVLWRSKMEPNVLVGSRVPQFKGSSLSGRSKYFVAETDEYQNKLQYFKPRGVVLNNIDYDHPDFFKTEASYVKAFSDFIKKIPGNGFLVINNRDANTKKIRGGCRGKVISYDLVTGVFGSGADYLAYDLRVRNGQQIFRLSFKGEDLGTFKIGLWGEHNVLNALAVVAAARELKVALPILKKSLAEFKGTERRAQILGRYNGAVVIDDYAHHPTEIKATLEGLRTHYPDKRLITVFHPHTFTRTKALFGDFAGSFSQTDELIVLDVYGSAREKKEAADCGRMSVDLVDAIGKSDRRNRVRHIPTIPSAASYLKKRLTSSDVLLLMGAGDVFRIGQEILRKKKN